MKIIYHAKFTPRDSLLPTTKEFVREFEKEEIAMQFIKDFIDAMIEKMKSDHKVENLRRGEELDLDHGLGGYTEKERRNILAGMFSFYATGKRDIRKELIV